jgi:hypothetical protein
VSIATTAWRPKSECLLWGLHFFLKSLSNSSTGSDYGRQDSGDGSRRTQRANRSSKNLTRGSMAGIGPRIPSGESGLACDPFGYSGSGLTNAHQWTPQSRLEAMSRPSVFAGASARVPALLEIDPELSKVHPKSGRVTHRSRCPLRAESDVGETRREMTMGHVRTHAVRQIGIHSINTSARPDSDSGMVMPSVLAVLRLMYSSTLVACCTGRSAGFSPLRTRPT